MTPVADPFMADARATGLQKGSNCDGKVSIERMAQLWNDWHDLTLSLTNVTEQHPRRGIR